MLKAKKPGGKRKGAGRPKSPQTAIKRMFIPLEKRGFNVVLSIMCQNAVQFEASPDKKIEIYERIRRLQPQFVQDVVVIVGW